MVKTQAYHLCRECSPVSRKCTKHFVATGHQYLYNCACPQLKLFHTTLRACKRQNQRYISEIHFFKSSPNHR